MNPQSWQHSAFKLSMSPQFAFMLSFISFIIFFGGILDYPKANIIFPLELWEKGIISFVFHVILLFLRE